MNIVSSLVDGVKLMISGDVIPGVRKIRLKI